MGGKNTLKSRRIKLEDEEKNTALMNIETAADTSVSTIDANGTDNESLDSANTINSLNTSNTTTETTEDSKSVSNSNSGEKYVLLVEGRNLLDVMGIPGVNGLETVSNHILEVEAVLGIEAARSNIMKEIAMVYDSYGMNVDRRHLMYVIFFFTVMCILLLITHPLYHPPTPTTGY